MPRDGAGRAGQPQGAACGVEAVAGEWKCVGRAIRARIDALYALRMFRWMLNRLVLREAVPCRADGGVMLATSGV